MDISSQITVSIKPDSLKSQLNKIAYKPGSTIRLKVIELRGDRALIDFGAFRATADIKIPVMLGDELQARVLESGKQLKLGVINIEPKDPLSTDRMLNRLEIQSDEGFKKVSTDLRQILSQAIGSHGGRTIPHDIRNIFNSLNTYFEPFELKEIITKLIPRIQAYVENSGIFFEKTLERIISTLLENSEAASKKNLNDSPEVRTFLARNLKANLSMLQHLSENEEVLKRFFSPKALVSLRNIIDTLLSNIAHQQGRAVSQLDSVEPFQVFTYAPPLKEGQQTARLKVYYQKKQKSGPKKGYRISLMLSMDRLGDLRTDFFLLDKDLTITFFVREDPFKVKIQENFLELQELLHGFFNQILLKVIVSEKKVADFDREDFQVAGDRQVDLRI